MSKKKEIALVLEPLFRALFAATEQEEEAVAERSIDKTASKPRTSTSHPSGKSQSNVNYGRELIRIARARKALLDAEARRKKAPKAKPRKEKSVRPKGPRVLKAKAPQTPKKAPPAKVKRELVDPWFIASIILEELTLSCAHLCNFSNEVALIRSGRDENKKAAYEGVLYRVSEITAVSPESAWVRAQAKAAVSKLRVPGLDPLKAGLQDWDRTEHRCKRINQKIQALQGRMERRYTKKGTLRARPGKEVPFEDEMARMQAFTHYVCQGIDLRAEVTAHFRYGPGSSVGVRGKATHYYWKLHDWSCVEESIDLGTEALFQDRAVWELLGFDPRARSTEDLDRAVKGEIQKSLTRSVVLGDRLSFVWKKATMMRSIGAQPTVSGALQLGIDAVYKDALRVRVGINLEDQSVNQALARRGSLDGDNQDSPATVDFTSASNLIASRLVWAMFPREHRDVLFSTRSKVYWLDESLDATPQLRAYEMYAGMGNGTTFTVETILFAAMAYAVSPHLTSPASFKSDARYSVYGDDVVIPGAYVERFTALANFLGMKVNLDKSFHKGPFRESCGYDYWEGINVRPAYVAEKEGGLNEVELVGIHNTLADSEFFVLTNACARLRALYKRSFGTPLPTDPAGGLGFRPQGGVENYSVVEKDGKPVISPTWHRSLGYVLHVESKKEELVGMSDQVRLCTLLQQGGATERDHETSALASLRRDLKIRVAREVDLPRASLVTMLTNTLRHLAASKANP